MAQVLAITLFLMARQWRNGAKKQPGAQPSKGHTPNGVQYDFRRRLLRRLPRRGIHLFDDNRREPTPTRQRHERDGGNLGARDTAAAIADSCRDRSIPRRAGYTDGSGRGGHRWQHLDGRMSTTMVVAQAEAVIEAYFDGACEPNPNGLASYGAVIRRDGRTIWQSSERVPDRGAGTSNNLAEYAALIAVLRHLIVLAELQHEHITVIGDSQLVLNQMLGNWKIGCYVELAHEAKALLVQFPHIQGRWVPRRSQHDRG